MNQKHSARPERRLETLLGYQFTDPQLLILAMTHRSFGVPNNERLEFLGDSILNCCISTLIYSEFKGVDEGDLSRIRANLVRQQTLYDIAKKLDIPSYLRLGEGELKSGGHRRPSILADCLEAIFGAIYLDSGFLTVREVVVELFRPVLKDKDALALEKDPKTMVQEFLQAYKLPTPAYNVVARRGAAHLQEFDVECVIAKLDITAHGTGTNRRTAEQSAAKRALEMLEKEKVHLPELRKKVRQQKEQLSLLGVATRQNVATDNMFSFERELVMMNDSMNGSANNKAMDDASENKND